MDNEIAQQVSQLLKKKIKLEEDLQKLLSKGESFMLAFWKSAGHQELNFSNDSRHSEFLKKIKYLTILEIQKEIEKLEDQIKSLKYY
jgi:molybdopterin-guanine dinucleotide biosynthesis protein A